MSSLTPCLRLFCLVHENALQGVLLLGCESERLSPFAFGQTHVSQTNHTMLVPGLARKRHGSRKRICRTSGNRLRL